MTQIGFLTNTQKNNDIIDTPTQSYQMQKGMQIGIQTLKEFLDSTYHPALRGTERELFFMGRLRNIKELYFENR